MKNSPELIEYSVSEFSQAIKRRVEGAFPLIKLRGEVSDLSPARSGHYYFTLKENQYNLSAVLWRSTAMRMSNLLNRVLEEGAEIIVTGKVTTFSGSSRYQIVVEDIELSGPGALIAQVEELQRQLEKEGIFNLQKEENIPQIPEIIGVVTSPTGSVIRDILHRISERFPRKVIVWPVAVQGENCPREVTEAIEGFNNLTMEGQIPRPDVLIIARGGGSFTDLFGFNDEQVVRATANSEIPVVSAVGHETDTTLIDYAANKRAPTPTAAAEFVVPVRTELKSILEREKRQINENTLNSLEAKGQRILDIGRGLPVAESLFALNNQMLDNLEQRLNSSLIGNLKNHESRYRICSSRLTPQDAIDQGLRKVDYLQKRFTPRLIANIIEKGWVEKEGKEKKLEERIEQVLKTNRDRLETLKRLLSSLSYKQTLQRGYVILRQDMRVVTRAKDLLKQKIVEVEMADGEISLEIIED